MNRSKKLTAMMMASAMVLTMASGVSAEEGSDEERMTLQLWTSNRDAMENEDAYYVKKIEDEFNVDIEMCYRNEGAGDYQEWLTLALSSDDAPDWFRDQAIGTAMLQSYADQGLVAELDPEMIKENMPNLMAYYEKYSDIFGEDPLHLYEVDGSIYSIPDAFPPSAQFCLMAVRQDWLDAVGLEAPKTLDEFTEVLRAFTKNDPDGDGVDNTYGYVGITGSPMWGFSPIFGAFGITPDIWYAKEDGTITRGELEVEPMKAALTYIKGLIDEGLVDPDWMTMDFNDSQNKVVSSVDGVVWQNWISILDKESGWYSALYQSDEDVSFYVTDGPVGENGDHGVMQFNPLAGVGLCFSVEMEDEPEKMAKYMQVFDAIAGDPQWLEAEIWGVEGETFQYTEDGGREYIGTYTDEDARTAYGIGTCYAFPSLEVYQYDPETMDSIMYSAETYKVRNETIGLCQGRWNILGSYPNAAFEAMGTEYPEYFNNAITEILMGQRPVEDYADIVQEWLDNGGQEAVDCAQELYNQHFGN